MNNSEDVHKLTDAIYKNLDENFINCVRQILLAGKAYYKALQGVTNTAHAYNDALNRLGTTAKVCRGGTEEIGEAILQIAETQREIHHHHEQSRKALFTELILPLEQKLEKDFKKAHSDARKYSQGHKVVLAPYNKAFDSLKKFRKKTKSKYVYDTDKEAQIMRTLDKCQEKLDDYRVQGFKQALLEERRCHCFLLQRLCAMSRMNAITHRHGADLYTSLPDWEDVCANPQMLPPSADAFLAVQVGEERLDALNGVPGGYSNGNGFMHREPRDTQSLANGFGRSRSTHDIFRQSEHFDGTQTLPHRSVPPSVGPAGAQVQAMYSFEASVGNQLSFTEGDLISVMGEISDGWQYGQNINTQQLGWFPLSFTKPLQSERSSPDIRPGRYKSVGDLLDSRSLSEHVHNPETDIPGNVRRPKSLYEGHPQSPLHHGHSVPQQQHPAAGNPYGSPARRQPMHPPPPPPALPHSGRNDDDGGIEDNVDYQSNPMFSSVSLRQTKTNDRSAPKI